MSVGKKIIISLGLLLLNMAAFAQQDAEFTQYMYTNQTYNAAFAGLGDFFNTTVFYRKQWVGFANAPTTQNLNVSMPFKRKNIGVGLNMINDQIGITGSLTGSGAFSYHIRMKAAVLSMGLNIGFRQSRLYGDQLDIRDNGDPTLANSTLNNIQPDMGFGLVYKTKIYYIGLSVQHLNTGKLKLSDTATSNSKMSRHYYLTAGYNYEINDKMILTPTVLFSLAESSSQFSNNFAADFAVQWQYMEMFWAGTSYRSNDAMSLFCGINTGKISPESFKEQIKIGYAFEWSNSRIPNYNAGTHEIFISYDLPLKQKRQMPKFK